MNKRASRHRVWARPRHIPRQRSLFHTVLFLVISLFPACRLAFHRIQTDQSKRSYSFPFPELADSLWLNSYYIMWTTPFDMWRERQTLFLNLLYIHHPEANVSLIATHPPPVETFGRYMESGYKLNIVRLDKQTMIDNEMWVGPGSRAWVLSLEDGPEENGPFFYSHYTDYMRFYLLYKHGGIYLDVDSLTVHPYPEHEFVGIDESPGDPEDWFWDPGAKQYLAPGVLKLAPGKAFLRNVLENHFNPSTYDPKCYNCVGPKAFNVEFKKAGTLERDPVMLLPKHKLYPYPYTEAHRLLKANLPDAAMLTSKLLHTSYAVHLFGKMSRDHSIGVGSVVNRISQTYQLFHAEPMRLQVQVPDTIVIRDPERQRLNGPRTIYISMPAAGDTHIERLELSVHTGQLALEGSMVDGSIQKYQNIHVADRLSVADANRLLSRIAYYAGAAKEDEMCVTVWQENGMEIQAKSRIVMFHHWVTFITYTHGRHDQVERLYKSLQLRFPRTEHLASNDLPDRDNDGLDDYQSRSRNSHLRWVPTVREAGLPACRNTMLRMAKSEFVFLIDDGFAVGEFATFETLLRVLLTTGFDVAAPYISNSSRDSSGLIQVNASGSFLVPGSHGLVQGCSWVEHVPDVFLGRRSAMLNILWDPKQESGGPEEFFLRAKMKGLKILSCNHIFVRRPVKSKLLFRDRKLSTNNHGKRRQD